MHKCKCWEKTWSNNNVCFIQRCEKLHKRKVPSSWTWHCICFRVLCAWSSYQRFHEPNLIEHQIGQSPTTKWRFIMQRAQKVCSKPLNGIAPSVFLARQEDDITNNVGTWWGWCNAVATMGLCTRHSPKRRHVDIPSCSCHRTLGCTSQIKHV